MSKDAIPLCSTCGYHEKQSGRINIMWGMGWAVLIVFGTIVALISMGQQANRTNISVNTNRISAHERTMDNSIHKVEQVLTIMSLNQKRQMEHTGLNYLDPERMSYYMHEEE